MYARVMNILFQADALPRVVAHFREASVPMVVGFPGFDAMLAAINRASGRIWLVTIWNSEQARDASAVDPAFIQNMASFADWMAGGFNRESYDVIANTLQSLAPADDDDAPPCVRLTIVTLDPARIDEAGVILADLADPVAHNNEGFRGAVVMLSAIQSRAIVFEHWRDQSSLDESDDVPFRAGQRLRASGCLTLAPMVETLELRGVWRAQIAGTCPFEQVQR